jgi:hypothetical protein
VFKAASVCIRNIHTHGACIHAASSIRRANSNAPYLGFDERDVAAYNLSSDYLTDHRLAELELNEAGVDDSKECVMVYLLIVFQIFNLEIGAVVSAVRTQRTAALLDSEHSEDGLSTAEHVVNANIESLFRHGDKGCSWSMDSVQDRLQTKLSDIICEFASALMHPQLHLDEDVKKSVYIDDECKY